MTRTGAEIIEKCRDFFGGFRMCGRVTIACVRVAEKWRFSHVLLATRDA